MTQGDIFLVITNYYLHFLELTLRILRRNDNLALPHLPWIEYETGFKGNKWISLGCGKQNIVESSSSFGHLAFEICRAC